ncbi:[Glutamate--ammonia-ligase] adenylyltransferase [Alteripontixanthobacter maritimus]|uniref:[Glutamate--ammonia-ligase] adenylyltransferase n=1 Tax=Alteripontixanthobacter maritimus TaxID=2161824 RepID=A0A369QA98_9SPHN|nr:bifunctional [glutamine synthetase] adenylyltransferase/[glutamine synthetase]-adenylyl-L-tyrosine phosphorylase [Alteripontixanthobacter maritimus]RDC61270.1 [Glutamate--ammonia-ligase] adenylyltransferase [Alteripontixanthobacter maritimus]
MEPDWTSALERARAEAPFLARGLDRLPDLATMLAAGDGEAALAHARAAGEGIAEVGVALRRERTALAIALAIGDLAGAFSLDRVMAELSALADRALDAAMAAAVMRRLPDLARDDATRGFIALALGKHGAGELNYSSDIDPILLYDPDNLPRRPRDEPGEAAQRYARDVVQLLSDVTAEGYVFRVDLRLRPQSEVSPLAIPLGGALSHYESSALAWERAAFIRARAASGDIAAGAQFLDAIQSFVWRRSLDFGAAREIAKLTARIRSANGGPPHPQPGFDLKQGRGGIREIEFFTQTHQLIHGGRDPSLRVRGTKPALAALVASERIGTREAEILGTAYDRLRTAEHRIQMVRDQQTHSLPAGDALDPLARLDGFADGAALLDDLRKTTADVARIFDTLIETDDTSPAPRPNERKLARQLGAMGFGEGERLAARITGWRDGRFRALRSDGAREAFDALLPALLEAFAAAPEPARALMRFETLLEKLPSAINLFRLLEARPALLDQLVDIITLAPPLADRLARRPELLDALIDRSALDLPGPVDTIAASMRRGVEDYERQLDRIRIVTGEKRFALGVQLIEAAQDPLDIAEGLARVAEAALTVAQHAAEEEFAIAHGRVPGAEPVVLGLGRLGGGALTHASDLDIVHLFTGDHAAQSDGDRPLGATLYFNRLAQRIGGALSVPTAQGALYEVDTRLRPQGAQGPLAVSLDSFARYQRQDAWTWEHMALCRARALTGSLEARAEVAAVIESVLMTERDPGKLRADVMAMRAEMAAHKAPQGELDAKLRRGGLVDCEFLVHYLQLRHRTGLSPDVTAAIATLETAGHLPDGIGKAHRLMTRLLVAGRLFAPDGTKPPARPANVLAKSCRLKDMMEVESAFTSARDTVKNAWADIFGERFKDEI